MLWRTREEGGSHTSWSPREEVTEMDAKTIVREVREKD
jgi:hypothetical protein